MAETPKKIIDSEYKCFLCDAFTHSSRVKIFGKSGLDIPRLIESAVGENLGKYENSGSQMFICTKCYKRLLRLEKAKKNLEGIKEEICGIYQSINRRVKRQITDANVSENIAPHTTTKPSSAAKSLKFTESSTTATNDDFPTTCTSSDSGPAEVSENFLAWKSPQYSGAVIRQTFGAPLLSSTPVSSTQKTSNQSKASIENTTVKLSVSYPSKTVNKTLPKDYEALGKSLVHGPPSRIATAVLKCAPLTHLVIEKVLRLLKAEVGDLCSKKNPSSLRNCTKEALINFDLEKLCNEWKERAPLFYSFLLTVTSGKSQKSTTWFPSMAVAGSILLKQRNPQMNATASALSLVLKTRSTEVKIGSYCLIREMQI